MLTATAAELQELHGVGPTVASAIILFRGHNEVTKPEDLLRVPGIGPVIFDRIKMSIRVGGEQRDSRASNLVDVLVQKRKLESLDIETPMGKFRTLMSGDAIVPDPTYKLAAGGRDKILLAAHEAAAKTIRAACNDARESGVPAFAIVSDLRRFLLICRTEQQRPPFDLAEILQLTPLFRTLAGNWLAFDWLKSAAQEDVLYWSTEGDREDVLCLTEAEVPLVERLLDGHLQLQRVASAWASSEAPAEGHIEGDPILDTVVDLLLDARGGRTDLFDDELARGVRWATLDRGLCRVTAGWVDINADHPLVTAGEAAEATLERARSLLRASTPRSMRTIARSWTTTSSSSSPASSGARVNELTKRLRGDREAVASGHLTLDREKARQKLQKFRLPDPHMYVLQLVRAASVLGATKIEFTVEPSTTTCVFDAVFEEFTVDEMWGAAFEERRGIEAAALHNLALAMASAQALNPAFIEVESGGTKLRIDVEDAEHEPSSSDIDGTRITVKEKFRFGHLVEFFESQFGELPETRALERVCEFFPDGGHLQQQATEPRVASAGAHCDGGARQRNHSGFRLTVHRADEDDPATRRCHGG